MSKGDRQASGGEPVSRRDILQVSTGTAAIAGAAALITGAGSAAPQQLAQNAPPSAPANNGIRTGEPQPFYDYSPITKRPKLKWPNGARVAVFIVPNVEHWDVHDDKGHMDVRNLPRNDYGLRVAVWRLMEIFGNRKIPTTIALNASVCRFYPELIEAFRTRGDELMGHGVTNSEHLDTSPPAKAAAIVRQAVDMIRSATGQRVRGWLGPGLGEADGTLDALKAAGIEYVCDWGPADDQPFRLKNGMYAVPYTLDINDLGLIDRQGTPASQFAAYIVDAFDTLYREGADQARVLPIALHPFLTGAPHRAPHLAKALDYIRGHDRVWFARGGEILDAYRASVTGPT
jgi:peptidoglycan/xylan/chitin deacetylase (PgdA/CDA1 family)